MNARLRSALVALDDRLQSAFSVKTPIYTRDPNVLAGAGVYAASDWSRTRRSIVGSGDGDCYASDARYLEYIRTTQADKMAAVTSLLGTFDFCRFGKIFEIGCGDMIQALHVTRACPNLHYVATDFDPYVIERCLALPVLAPLHKRVFDVINDSHEAFAGFDLLVSWGVDAVLDDRQFTRLLESVKRQAIPYLMCSPTTAGPILRAHEWSSTRARRRELEEHQIRMHGWARSVAYFHRLARAAGLPVRRFGRHGIYACLLFGDDLDRRRDREVREVK